MFILTPTKKPDADQLSEEQKAFNRILSAVRAIVERPFRVVKRQFGFVKVRYRGLAKNTQQVVTLFALANLWLVRKRLLPLLGTRCPRETGNAGEKTRNFTINARKSPAFHHFYDSPSGNRGLFREALMSPEGNVQHMLIRPARAIGDVIAECEAARALFLNGASRLIPKMNEVHS